MLMSNVAWCDMCATNDFWRIDRTFYRSPKQLQRLHFPAEHLAFSLIPSFFFSSSLKACFCEGFYLLRLLQYLTLSLFFPSHAYFALFLGQVPLDQRVSEKKGVEKSVKGHELPDS